MRCAPVGAPSSHPHPPPPRSGRCTAAAAPRTTRTHASWPRTARCEQPTPQPRGQVQELGAAEGEGPGPAIALGRYPTQQSLAGGTPFPAHPPEEGSFLGAPGSHTHDGPANASSRRCHHRRAALGGSVAKLRTAAGRHRGDTVKPTCAMYAAARHSATAPNATSPAAPGSTASRTPERNAHPQRKGHRRQQRRRKADEGEREEGEDAEEAVRGDAFGAPRRDNGPDEHSREPQRDDDGARRERPAVRRPLLPPNDRCRRLFETS